jgi:hypothetical protein
MQNPRLTSAPLSEDLDFNRISSDLYAYWSVRGNVLSYDLFIKLFIEDAPVIIIMIKWIHC